VPEAPAARAQLGVVQARVRVAATRALAVLGEGEAVRRAVGRSPLAGRGVRVLSMDGGGMKARTSPLSQKPSRAMQAHTAAARTVEREVGEAPQRTAMRPGHGRLEQAGESSAGCVSVVVLRCPVPLRCMGRRAGARRCPACLRRAACVALVLRRKGARACAPDAAGIAGQAQRAAQLWRAGHQRFPAIRVQERASAAWRDAEAAAAC